MITIQRIAFIITTYILLGFSWPFSGFFSTPNTMPFGTNDWIRRQITIIEGKTSGLNDNVLKLSLIAYIHARQQGLDSKQLLTVIDYSMPSTSKRMWVIDLRRGRVLFNTWVSHGKNSGGITPDSFSNSPGSLKTSLGVFVTDMGTYQGGNGNSLRLKGLERGINNNAYSRDIVIHGAAYVNSATISKYGQIGRSWGCPAVSKDLAQPIINTIKDNTVVIAYYPDRNWLSHSRYLAG